MEPPGSATYWTPLLWARSILSPNGKNSNVALGSDAFFPFDDCAKAAAAAGITAIIQPGGAGNDQDSIDVCNANGITMVFTGMRHFRH